MCFLVAILLWRFVDLSIFGKIEIFHRNSNSQNSYSKWKFSSASGEGGKSFSNWIVCVRKIHRIFIGRTPPVFCANRKISTHHPPHTTSHSAPNGRNVLKDLSENGERKTPSGFLLDSLCYNFPLIYVSSSISFCVRCLSSVHSGCFLPIESVDGCAEFAL